MFVQICAVDSKTRIFSATECISAVQGHPRSMILVPIESAYATSYSSVIVPLVLSIAPFLRLRYDDLFTEKCVFFVPLSHSAPPLPMFPLEFRHEINLEETKLESWGYPAVKAA